MKWGSTHLNDTKGQTLGGTCRILARSIPSDDIAGHYPTHREIDQSMAEFIRPANPSQPQWQMTMAEFLDQAAARSPDKVWLHWGNQRITYAAFQKGTKKAAGLFKSLGVGTGDTVCVFLPNGPEFLTCWFGLARLGALCVPINTAYKHDEAAYLVENAGAKVLIAHESLMEVAEALHQGRSTLEHYVSVGADTPEGWLNFSDALSKSLPLTELPGVAPQDGSMLVYTSGTTGRPKGVIVTHEMYVASGQGFATWTQATADDSFFTCLPLFHANAQYYSTMGSMAAGASIIMEGRFSASQFWEQVGASGATIVNFIGMMLPVLLKQPTVKAERAHNVRLFYGSPSFPLETLAEFEARFNTTLIIGFALTESCYGTIERIGQPHRSGTAGQPRWHPDPRFKNELRIADDQGEPVDSGAVGEILLRSPAVMPGYWQDPERTAEALQDGWLHTGDLGWVDGDGYLYFMDRQKDVIRRRGENISSQEVESIIKEHPKVADCAAVPVPAELGEEEVKVYVVLQPNVTLPPEDVIHWCADRLARFKVPRYVEFRDDLPRTPTMRVRKDVLRTESKEANPNVFDREAAGIKLK